MRFPHVNPFYDNKSTCRFPHDIPESQNNKHAGQRLGLIVWMEERGLSMFFIYDCNGRIIGNPKGYRTMKSADRWSSTRAMQALIHERYDAREDKTCNHLYSIKHKTPPVNP